MKKNAIQHILQMTFAAAFLLLAAQSCAVKISFHDTSHPDSGRVSVTADWSGRGSGIAVPAKWNMSLGDYSGTETGQTHTPDCLFTPGDYRLVAWNPADGITVAGTKASVATTAEGLLDPTPGWLFTCVQDVTVEADRDHAFTAVMEQQLRQLTLTIRLTGDAAERVAGISCLLSGVAGAMDFASDTYGAPSGVALNFTKITQGENAGAWTATVRLLGITGESLMFTGSVTYSGDILQPTPLESDMTVLLAGFNDNKTVPLGLACDLETPTQAGVTATITVWEQQDEVDIEIK